MKEPIGFYGWRRPINRAIFNGICTLVWVYLFYSQMFRYGGGFNDRVKGLSRDELNVTVVKKLRMSDPKICFGLYDKTHFKNRCEYLIVHPECASGGFFNYTVFFYCDCAKLRSLGYIVLTIWLAALFYLLGNTAADYFCCSLEKLSSLLKLPPTVAGVFLLPLGNGAPDVFASIAAFVGKDAGAVGLNSVLGGAVFVVCIVAGAVSLSVAESRVQINRTSFLRDICFFLFTLVFLGCILIMGEVNIGVAIAYVSIYAIYAFVVAADEIFCHPFWRLKLDATAPLLPVSRSLVSQESGDESGYALLLESRGESDVPLLRDKVPQWMWASNVAIYSNEALISSPEAPKSLWGWNEEEPVKKQSFVSRLLSLLEMPLVLPRRLTIPIIEEDRWSKNYAVASASLAPLLLAVLWNSHNNQGSLSRQIVYIVGVAIGMILGVLAYLHTKPDHPPQRFLLPWVLGGFCMSIVWFYIVANELVALLVALGEIFGISPSILGVTVLAWGNSMGDLMSNIALAMHGGDSIQIAMSGCYAGPMFNTLTGLGISLLFGAWSQRPTPYAVPPDGSLFYTMGFLVFGLIWSLIMLPRYDMHPNKILGFGLLAIYMIFLVFKVSMSVGFDRL